MLHWRVSAACNMRYSVVIVPDSLLLPVVCYPQEYSNHMDHGYILLYEKVTQ